MLDIRTFDQLVYDHLRNKQYEKAYITLKNAGLSMSDLAGPNSMPGSPKMQLF